MKPTSAELAYYSNNDHFTYEIELELLAAIASFDYNYEGQPNEAEGLREIEELDLLVKTLNPNKMLKYWSEI